MCWDPRWKNYIVLDKQFVWKTTDPCPSNLKLGHSFLVVYLLVFVHLSNYLRPSLARVIDQFGRIYNLYAPRKIKRSLGFYPARRIKLPKLSSQRYMYLFWPWIPRNFLNTSRLFRKFLMYKYCGHVFVLFHLFFIWLILVRVWNYFVISTY